MTTSLSSSKENNNSSLNVNIVQKREIHEATWEFLHSEMLQLLIQSSEKAAKIQVASKETKSKGKESTNNSNAMIESGGGTGGNDGMAPDHNTLTTEGLLGMAQRQEELDQEDSKKTVQGSLTKLDSIGYSVGITFIERITKERPRFVDQLEIMKFICKEFWTEIFKKQIDNLRTNRRGIFVLHDAKFRWLLKLSSESSLSTRQAATKYLLFPCGLIRGALANLGITATVSGEIVNCPSCNFTIKIET
eukprot:TRINITY_DN1189_c0_g1_i1.p1 TRINITY_DN1189_c0_g1~~TRINITY_DN1189_c0_g1_i1.p1  ORF type:complete len:261 (-),score=86.38 TRINITY_DN1189_c0_g1_i1:68-811(-)